MKKINLSSQATPEHPNINNQKKGASDFNIHSGNHNIYFLTALPHLGRNLQENIELIKSNYPQKTLFSIKETVHILRTTDEFIRQNIHAGKIQKAGLGSRIMIDLDELSKLMTKGIQLS